MNKTHFKIIIPFYNIEKWAKNTINSVKAQNYDNYECYFINDLSTDESSKIIKKNILDDKRFNLLENSKKRYPLENIKKALRHCNPNKEDVVIILHGDDWFANRNVLTTLNQIYNEKKCWLTYGSYVEYPSGKRGKFSREVPKAVIENNLIRQVEWMTSHLHTFKYGLWINLKDESFIEDENVEHHFYGAWDLAWMYPLFEMAAFKSQYVKDVLYVYNRDNPLNVDKVNQEKQLRSEKTIRTMNKYSPLEEY